jgi:predicted outer membrane repeat protein
MTMPAIELKGCFRRTSSLWSLLGWWLGLILFASIVEGTLGDSVAVGFTFSGRSLEEVVVDDMDGVFNYLSNHPVGEWEGVDNQGNSIIDNGGTVVLAAGVYKCSSGTCAGPTSGAYNNMIHTNSLNGEVKCTLDDANSCIMDGEESRRILEVVGTGVDGKLIITAVTFKNGKAQTGGGILITTTETYPFNAQVDLKLCVFSFCNSQSAHHGGGAIYLASSAYIEVNIYGTSFMGNTAAGDGDDILSYGSGSTTNYNTCPSPYSYKIPIQGKVDLLIV